MSIEQAKDAQPMRLFSTVHQVHIWVAICIAAMLQTVGCGKPETQTQSQPDRPDVTLNVLAIDSPAIAAAASRLWSAEGLGNVEFTEITENEFVVGDFQTDKEYDAIVYPSKLMSDLVALNRLIAIPKDELDSEEVNRDELLPHQRKKLLLHQNKVWSIPLGSPQLMLMYNKADFAELELKPPQTWTEFEKVARALQAADKKVRVPLQDSWAAEVLLSRVASAIRAQGKLSTVFDVQTMKPLVETEPFVKALGSLKQICSAEDAQASPADVFRALVDGRASMGITWPSRNFADAENSETVKENEDLVLLRLPGSEQWYNQSKATWEIRRENDPTQVDVVGGTGRLVSVCKESQHARVAMEFTCWLGSKSTSKTVSISSPHVSIFRSTHLGQPTRWAGEEISYEVADQFSNVFSEISESSLVLQFPRIPGQVKYMQALDDAVRNTVTQNVDTETSLAEVTQQWEAITQRLGREEQGKQLRRSVGY